MRLRVGDRIPPGVLKFMGRQGPKPISIDELFNGRRVVLFSVSGAFTPKSTTMHVPSYLNLADKIFSHGVDDILCVSVNDAHVMDAWANYCGSKGKIRMLADGHCEFFMALGLEMDCTRFTLGYRCQRFSLIADNRVTTHLNIEEPGEYRVSGAETIVAQLESKRSRMQGGTP